MTRLNPTTRRRFIQLGIAATACGVANPALALPRLQGVRAMAFHNLHTDERLNVTYWRDGTYDRAAWAGINHILRDHYSGDSCAMNLRLVDLLYDLQQKLQNDRPVEIISGYRSPKTNMILAKAGGGVAKNSYHSKGMAIDIRMDGTPLPTLHDTALAMRRGGVGYYPDSPFVHIDVGPARMS